MYQNEDMFRRFPNEVFKILRKKTTKSCTTINSDGNLHVIIEKDDRITLIGMNRPDARNSINTTTAKKLNEAITAFEADEESPIAVLYGIGGSFSAGYDVAELEENIEQNRLDFLFNSEGSVGPTRRQLRKPIVCGINGYCVGAGVELALACDLRVMEDTAIMGFFNRYLGVPISNAGTVRLANIVGYSRAMDIIATGRRMSAKEAFEIGLVNRIVATGTALGQAVNLAFSIAKFSQVAIQHDRDSLLYSVYTGNGFQAGIQNEIVLMSQKVIDELKIGARKFSESNTKGARTDSFNIKEKQLPDWEREEIFHEAQYAKKLLSKR